MSVGTITPPASELAAQDRDTLLGRFVQATAETFMLYGVYIGDQLGFYQAIAEGEPLTSEELAVRTGTNERYVREWLEHQTVTGILRVEDASAAPKERVFSLPEGHKEVLVNRESLNYLAPICQLAVGVTHPIEKLLGAFRRGNGIPYEEYGKDMLEGQARMNRAAFLCELGQEWLPSIPDIHSRLHSDPPARIADIGCGAGWSSIGMAKSYPKVRVDGFDVDKKSIEMASRNAWEAGVPNRVSFHMRDAGATGADTQYDLVTAFECVHDMSDPVSVLRSMKQLVSDGGAVVVMDERVGETFTPAGNEVEPLMYGFSVLHCLPVGMSEQPSAGTGTVMRPDKLRDYARSAGFQDVEILPIENFFFRFYRLR